MDAARRFFEDDNEPFADWDWSSHDYISFCQTYGFDADHGRPTYRTEDMEIVGALRQLIVSPVDGGPMNDCPDEDIYARRRIAATALCILQQNQNLQMDAFCAIGDLACEASRGKIDFMAQNAHSIAGSVDADLRARLGADLYDLVHRAFELGRLRIVELMGTRIRGYYEVLPSQDRASRTDSESAIWTPELGQWRIERENHKPLFPVGTVIANHQTTTFGVEGDVFRYKIVTELLSQVGNTVLSGEDAALALACLQAHKSDKTNGVKYLKSINKESNSEPDALSKDFEIEKT